MLEHRFMIAAQVEMLSLLALHLLAQAVEGSSTNEVGR
jgi:hypothetical protein